MLHTIDELMASRATPIVLVLAHLGALIWALGPRKSIVPVLMLNVFMAVAILGYNAEGFGRTVKAQDWALLALIGFGLAHLCVATAALAGRPIPRAFVWTGFSIDFALSLLLMVFMLLFKIERLI